MLPRAVPGPHTTRGGGGSCSIRNCHATGVVVVVVLLLLSVVLLVVLVLVVVVVVVVVLQSHHQISPENGQNMPISNYLECLLYIECLW